jgi:hypothetical protein
MGRGRKLGPTLFETHKEMSVAKTSKPRSWKILDISNSRAIFNYHENLTRIAEFLEVNP